VRLHLVRHGETDWNAAKKIQGTIDIDLNTKGRGQADELGAVLASGDTVFTGLVTSTMKRARTTARILEGHLGLPAREVADLHEMDFGAWQGLTWAEVEARYPTEFRLWLGERRTIRVPQGESYDALLGRVVNALIALCPAGAAGEVLVVTHGAVILSLRCLAAGVDFAEMDRFRVGNLERFVLEAADLQSWAEALADGGKGSGR